MFTSFGKALRHHRKKMELTQAELASLLDYAPSSIAKWEADDYVPPKDKFERLIELKELELTDGDKQELRDLRKQLLFARSSSQTDQQKSIEAKLPDNTEELEEDYIKSVLVQYNQPTSARIQRTILTGIAVLLAIGLLFTVRLWLHPKGGYLDVRRFCEERGFTNVLVSDKNPYSWRCLNQADEEVRIDFNQACHHQYRHTSLIATLQDTEDSQSWWCSTTRIVTYGNGWCGAVPIEITTSLQGSRDPQLFFDRQTIQDGEASNQLFLYFHGEYVDPSIATLGKLNSEQNQWQVTIDEEWTAQWENFLWQNTALWRLDYKC